MPLSVAGRAGRGGAWGMGVLTLSDDTRMLARPTASAEPAAGAEADEAFYRVTTFDGAAPNGKNYIVMR
jgi:hypothetical protein